MKKLEKFAKNNNLVLVSEITNGGGYGKPCLVFDEGNNCFTYIYGVSSGKEYSIAGYRFARNNNGQVIHNSLTNFNSEKEYNEVKDIKLI